VNSTQAKSVSIVLPNASYRIEI